VHSHVPVTFRVALKKAYDELIKNGCALDVSSFLEFMVEYKPLMPKWKALCTFKALQSIEDRKEKCTTHSSTDDDPCPILTVQQFYNLYEALDFKWTPPAVCHNFTLALCLDAYTYICLSYLKKKENLLFWCLVVKDCWKDICKWHAIFFLVE